MLATQTDANVMRHGREAFADAYIEALYFTDTGDTGQPPSDAELSSEARAAIERDCAAFWRAHEHTIFCAECSRGYVQYSDDEQAGHDFWLTRNGHGVGFWDGDWTEPQATALDNAAKAFGECHIYLGDDGLIHIDGE